jgi:hypothetical protein
MFGLLPGLMAESMRTGTADAIHHQAGKDFSTQGDGILPYMVRRVA